MRGAAAEEAAVQPARLDDLRLAERIKGVFYGVDARVVDALRSRERARAPSGPALAALRARPRTAAARRAAR